LLGYLYRIYGLEDANQLKKAQMYFINCLTYAIEKQDRKKEITTLIRLGEVNKYQNQHENALVQFHKAITLCQEKGMNQLLEFAYQHLGKCLMEMKCYDEANKILQLALQIRLEKGNRELINSTRNSLKYNSIYRNES
jgi:HTH-type transcriptional regulator, pleiotropic regulator of extracellular virulence genes